jgi:type I restriction enzyme S subunit
MGNYIEFKNEFNDGNSIKELLGINNNKYFQKSQTNTIGIDLSKYRVVRNKQFAYNRATTRNGEKISIALRQGGDCIVSPSYRIFNVKDESKLNSEYLMMWFRRPEFDRYARFKSHGSAHEFFEIEQMNEVELPIPSPEKQREIVNEYNAVQKRIDLNKQLIQKLEETAQAIYKQWFVDFEFPDEEGKPYKSSGGEMIESELGKIPKGWRVGKIGNVAEIIGGGTPSTEIEDYWNEGDILWYSPTDITKNNSIFSCDTEKKITISGLNNSSAKIIPPYSLLMTSRATIGKLTINTKEASTNQGFIVMVPKEEGISTLLLFDWIKTKMELINTLASGSTFLEISKSDFKEIDFCCPDKTILDKYYKTISPIFNDIHLKEKEKVVALNLQSFLLSKLATIEK